ncbi:MAG: hypothetical protein A2119_01805 [Candidatus Colwellbacteria bacterium GWA2_46_10]|uniref:DUF5343 domain-containing protein n=1 Tax=Candidatus Colwellbacteria bacterium GWA2_46_10 TaxID=1797684 RepID=A0A1G1YWJ6_9BACT|nr:MAG: hypothetical protein A2119_01805 [Candidatus Colwellbacteria bacterium GWA2_46_10]
MKSLKTVIQQIPKTGVPAKFTQGHLKSMGYKSTNDRRIITVLKAIGFLDGSGTPTEAYKGYRGGGAETVMANAVKSTYKELFNLYPNANGKDEESLTHFFATRTNSGERVQKVMVQTFKTLCELGNFSDTEQDFSEPEEDLASGAVVPKREKKGGFPLNINIELQMPPTDDPKIYEAFFKAMKKHLLDEE